MKRLTECDFSQIEARIFHSLGSGVIPANILIDMEQFGKPCVSCGHDRDVHWGTTKACNHTFIVNGKKTNDCNCGKYIENNLQWIKRHKKLSEPLKKLKKDEDAIHKTK